MRHLSMDSMEIPAVQRRIEAIDLATARAQAAQMLAFGRIQEVADYLKSLDSQG